MDFELQSRRGRRRKKEKKKKKKRKKKNTFVTSYVSVRNDSVTNKKTNMADSEPNSSIYFAISSIPESFHSADLRNYFSQFVESGGFQCFHYRHRPEIIREHDRPELVSGDQGSSPPPDTENEQGTPVSSAKKRTTKSRCCVVAVRAKDADRFVRMYAGNHWVSSKGNLLARRCVVKRVKVSNDKGQ